MLPCVFLDIGVASVHGHRYCASGFCAGTILECSNIFWNDLLFAPRTFDFLLCVVAVSKFCGTFRSYRRCISVFGAWVLHASILSACGQSAICFNSEPTCSFHLIRGSEPRVRAIRIELAVDLRTHRFLQPDDLIMAHGPGHFLWQILALHGREQTQMASKFLGLPLLQSDLGPPDPEPRLVSGVFDIYDIDMLIFSQPA